MSILKTIPDRQLEYLRRPHPIEKVEAIEAELIEFALSLEDRRALFELLKNPDEYPYLRCSIIKVLGRMEWGIRSYGSAQTLWRGLEEGFSILLYKIREFYRVLINSKDEIFGPPLLKMALADELVYYPRGIGFEPLLVDLLAQELTCRYGKYIAESACESLKEVLGEPEQAFEDVVSNYFKRTYGQVIIEE